MTMNKAQRAALLDTATFARNVADDFSGVDGNLTIAPEEVEICRLALLAYAAQVDTGLAIADQIKADAA